MNSALIVLAANDGNNTFKKMKFFICISLFIILIGTTVNANAMIILNHSYGNEKHMTLDSNGMDNFYFNNKKELI